MIIGLYNFPLASKSYVLPYSPSSVQRYCYTTLTIPRTCKICVLCRNSATYLHGYYIILYYILVVVSLASVHDSISVFGSGQDSCLGIGELCSIPLILCQHCW